MTPRRSDRSTNTKTCKFEFKNIYHFLHQYSFNWKIEECKSVCNTGVHNECASKNDNETVVFGCQMRRVCWWSRMHFVILRVRAKTCVAKKMFSRSISTMFRKTVVNWKHGDANAAAVPTSHIHTVLTSHIVNILSKKFWNKRNWTHPAATS